MTDVLNDIPTLPTSVRTAPSFDLWVVLMTLSDSAFESLEIGILCLKVYILTACHWCIVVQFDHFACLPTSGCRQSYKPSWSRSYDSTRWKDPEFTKGLAWSFFILQTCFRSLHFTQRSPISTDISQISGCRGCCTGSILIRGLAVGQAHQKLVRSVRSIWVKEPRGIKMAISSLLGSWWGFASSNPKGLATIIFILWFQIGKQDAIWKSIL